MAAAGDIGGGGVRRPSAAGSNTLVLLNQGGVEGASPNLAFDGGNLILANATTIAFGGNSANSANAPFLMSYNVSSNSVDIVFV